MPVSAQRAARAVVPACCLRNERRQCLTPSRRASTSSQAPQLGFRPVGQPRSLFPESIMAIGPRMGFALLLALFLLVTGSTVVSRE